MVYIAVCDDETAIGAEVERSLTDILGKQNIRHDIDVFLSSGELCRKIESGTCYDLIYLDIMFAKEGINGVEVGRFIRDEYKNYTTQIVYISWEQRYAMELFEIRPMNFLVKPLEYDRIEHTIKTYINIAGLLSNELIFKKGHDIFKARVNDIVYLENWERKVIIHFADGRKEVFYGSLKEIYHEQLKQLDFLFIHASYVVNYDYVTAVKYNQLFMTGNSTPLPISPNRRNDVRADYLAIIKRRRG